jgi:GxxExxY protein
MNTDARPDLRRGENVQLLLKEETQRIIGFSFDVLNEIGHGLNEKMYENALVVFFKQNAVAFDQQRRFAVIFRGVQVGEFVPDLIAFGSVIDRCKNHRPHHRLRARPDAELPPHRQTPCRFDPEFQARPPRVGPRGHVTPNPCSSVSIRG